MAIQTLNTIKQWFKTSLKPTQTQFWDTWDSFRHKFEKVPVKDIEGIDELLLTKADKVVLDNHLADKIAHAPQLNTDWNSESGVSQLINKPEFKTINGDEIIGSGDIVIDTKVYQTLQDVVTQNGNLDTTSNITFSNNNINNNGVVVKNQLSSRKVIMHDDGFRITELYGAKENTFLNSNVLQFFSQTPLSSFSIRPTYLAGSSFSLTNPPLNGNYIIPLSVNGVLPNPSTGDIILDKSFQNLQNTLQNGNETNLSALFKTSEDEDIYKNTINSELIEIKRSNTSVSGKNRTMSLKSELIDFVNLNTGEITALSSEGVKFGNSESNHFSTLGMNPATTANYSTILMPAITTEEETKTLATLDDIPTILPVSATQSGIVDNTSLQELGGVDKTIRNVRIGKGAGTVNGSTALGDSALRSNITGTQNTAVGSTTLRDNTTGGNNTAVGGFSLSFNSTGIQNTAVGSLSLYKNTSGMYNTAVGTQALQNNTIAIQNVAMGASALNANTTGEYNTAIGTTASAYTTTGDRNTMMGAGAGGGTDSNFTGSVAIGYNTFGETGNVSAFNTAIGYQAGRTITTGSNNILLGAYLSHSNLTTGSQNIMLSTTINRTPNGITTGSGNVIVGGVTGLGADSTNTIVLADGTGNIALIKNTNGEIITPNLTNFLITSGGAKSLITKDYLDEKTQIKDKQIIINGDIDVQENWNGQTIIFKSSGIIRMPIITTEEFSFNAITLEGVNLTWQWANQIEWVFGEPEITLEKKYFNLTKLGNTNQMILSV